MHERRIPSTRPLQLRKELIIYAARSLWKCSQVVALRTRPAAGRGKVLAGKNASSSWENVVVAADNLLEICELAVVEEEATNLFMLVLQHL
jgi:hypothetical protein